mgnify:CR=1 FL=1
MTLPYWSMIRGDTTRFEFTVTDDGEPIDLTLVELTWTAKRSWSDADDAESNIIKTLDDGITVTSAEDGTILIQMDAVDTEDIESQWPTWWSASAFTYVWDLVVLDDYEQRRTRGRGMLKVYRNVTAPAV